MIAPSQNSLNESYRLERAWGSCAWVCMGIPLITAVINMMKADTPMIEVIAWRDNMLHLLDQRLLPETQHYLTLSEPQEVIRAIQDMAVRGAPVIGISAAYGVVLSSLLHQRRESKQARAAIEHDIEQLQQARPTAVNLRWALQRMQTVLAHASEIPVDALLEEAVQIHQDEIDANLKMAAAGATLIPVGAKVLTHCNTGTLATGGHGTALGVIRTAYAKGKIKQVYASETRPWLQGARLTAWELIQDRIPASLVCEGAVASLMAQGEVDWVIVGADRIAANGDVANKIGTYALAVAARYHQVKLMVVAPISTIDLSAPSGADIPIEFRPADELLQYQGRQIAAQGVDAWNPVFDITPASLIDFIVTEAGFIEPPYTDKIAKVAGKGHFSRQS